MAVFHAWSQYGGAGHRIVTPPRFAVVLTHNRPALLWECVESVFPQVDHLIIVDNASVPPVPDDEWPANATVVHDPTQPPNLSRLWNTQLDSIQATEPGPRWDVVLLCDDVLMPSDWFDRVSTALRAHPTAAAASTHSYTPIEEAYLLSHLSNDVNRMCPWCFMLPGERGLRADETMHWWYTDTDVDMRARQSGGTLIVPGPIATNERVGEYTNSKPELAEQAGRDGEVFQAKWGFR
jgi:glycosyltransferase involved in cell wall biosynthesis